MTIKTKTRTTKAPQKPAGEVRTGKKGKANPIDMHVGTRLRMRRTLVGMSQEALADAVGITFQQVQKYENGANRVSASRLYQFSKILDTPVSFFFEQYTDVSKASGIFYGYGVGMADNSQEGFDNDQLYNKETLDLIRIYYSIPNAEDRRNVLRLIRSMAEKMQ